MLFILIYLLIGGLFLGAFEADQQKHRDEELSLLEAAVVCIAWLPFIAATITFKANGGEGRKYTKG